MPVALLVPFGFALWVIAMSAASGAAAAAVIWATRRHGGL